MILLNILILYLTFLYLFIIFEPNEKKKIFKKKFNLFPLKYFLVLFFILMYPICFFDDIFMFLYLLLFLIYPKFFNVIIFNIYYYFFYFSNFRFFFCKFQNIIIIIFCKYNIILFIKILFIFMIFFNIKLAFIIFFFLNIFDIIFRVINYNTDYFVIGYAQFPFEPVFLTKKGKLKKFLYQKNLLHYSIFSDLNYDYSFYFKEDYFFIDEKYNDFYDI